MRALVAWVLLASFSANIAVAADDDSMIVTGQMGVGTLAPRGRMGVRAGARDEVILRVETADGRTAMSVFPDGRVSIGLPDPRARLDVSGPSDAGVMNIFTTGNETDGVGPALAFGSDDGMARFEMRSQLSVDGSRGDALNISYRPRNLPWNSAQTAAFTIGGAASRRACAVQVRPSGPSVYELEVSAGNDRRGDGVVRYAESGEHSNGYERTVVSRLGVDAEARAYAEVLALKHYQYRPRSTASRTEILPTHIRGIRYDDAPESIRAPDRSVVLDERIMNLELALKVTDKRIGELTRLVEKAESK